ncbi:M24 family metallopeptidase [Chloroflexota bacterium]
MMNQVNRLEKLRKKLPEHEIDAIIVSNPENRYYLSGFYSSAGLLLISSKVAILATDFRYSEQAKARAATYDIIQIAGDMVDWFPELIGGLGLKKLGFEAGHLTHALYREFTSVLRKINSSIKLVATSGLVECLRAIKESEEIDLITQAVAISDNAFSYIESITHVGMKEEELAWELEKYMRENGSQALPFDIIVASGLNAAFPHAKPSRRALSLGDPVVIDIGAKIEGYCSDLSRTICLGKSDEKFNKIYDTILGAQMGVMAMIREGMMGGEVDQLARIIIEQAGYGKAFGHGLGHGIGLTPHEMPWLGPNSVDVLTSGMVITIEPGIYLNGWGGVRIEDVVVVENGKIRVISHAQKINIMGD